MMPDRRVLLPAVAQVLAMAAPFVYLRSVVVDHGPHTAVTSELVLSLTGYFAIAIDWSATTFLSRIQSRLMASGAYFSILVAKLAATLALLGFAAVFLAVSKASYPHDLLGIVTILMLGIAFDPSWIHVGRGRVWAPPAVGACRYVGATIIAEFGVDPIISLALAYCLTSLVFVIPLAGQIAWPSRLSLRLPFRIVRRYSVPTLTELLTATFSRLDVAAAAILLSTDQALVYAVCRKLNVGLQSVAFSSARLFYLERDWAKLQSLKRSLARTATVISLVGVPIAYIVASGVFLVPNGMVLVLTIIILGLLIPLGYFKTVVQFSYLYQKGRFGSDLFYSVLSLFVFAACGSVLGISGIDSAVLFSVIRLLADATYVAAAYLDQRSDGILG